jgi:tetratricopeptide (TPR) repeat protein
MNPHQCPEDVPYSGALDHDDGVSQQFPPPAPSLEATIAHYAQALQQLELAEAAPPLSDILSVLRKRDTVQGYLDQESGADESSLIQIIDLDQRLKALAAVIPPEQLAQCQESLDPPQSAWWWWMQPPPSEPPPQKGWAKFDWLWNLGTVTCLVLTASVVTQTARAFAGEGFDLLGTVSTISQGAGLAIVAGGALTDKGKKKVEQALDSVNIPRSLHAEVTFGAAFALLATSYGINSNLYVVGDWYFRQGQHHEEQGEWAQALNSYQRALNFNPDDRKAQLSIGVLYEGLGNYEEAIAAYDQGAVFGVPEFLNAKARTMLMQALQENGWQIGIDPQVADEVITLLRRVEDAVTNRAGNLSEFRTNPQLYEDMRINRAIAELAKVPADAPFAEMAGRLSDVLNRFSPVEEASTPADNPPPAFIENPESLILTELSTVGEQRTNCFTSKFVHYAHVLNFFVKAYDLDEFVSLPRVDPVHFMNEELHHCIELRYSGQNALSADASLLRNLVIDPLDEIWTESPIGQLYFAHSTIYYNSADDQGETNPEEPNGQVYVNRNLEQLLVLQNQIQKQIEQRIPERYTPPERVVWRVLATSDGEIIAAMGYDPVSRNYGDIMGDSTQDSPIPGLLEQLAAGESVAIADFKVVIAPDGQIETVQPWFVAYPVVTQLYYTDPVTDFLTDEEWDAFQQAFPASDTDFAEPSERAALGSVVEFTLLSEAVYPEDYPAFMFDRVASFQLDVTPDGRLVSYHPINEAAREDFHGRLPYHDLEPFFDESLSDEEVVSLQIHFKGTFSHIIE